MARTRSQRPAQSQQSKRNGKRRARDDEDDEEEEDATQVTQNGHGRGEQDGEDEDMEFGGAGASQAKSANEDVCCSSFFTCVCVFSRLGLFLCFFFRVCVCLLCARSWIGRQVIW
jgi:hypothetical protein